MHDSATSHHARATQGCLGSYGIEGERLMVWPPAASDLNTIENLWSIFKQDVHVDERQFKSKDILWKTIKVVAEAVWHATINN